MALQISTGAAMATLQSTGGAVLSERLHTWNSGVKWHVVLLRGLVTGILLAALSQCAAAQFAVRNLKKNKWPEAEAERIYLLASEAVQREFKLTRPVRPHFTLVLGFEGDQLDVNSGELRLSKWDRRLFADGVILFCMEQMLTAETRAQLLRRTLSAADATVRIDEAKSVARVPDATPEVSAASQPMVHPR